MPLGHSSLDAGTGEGGNPAARYDYPRSLALSLALAALLGRKRAWPTDAARLVGAFAPEPRVEGTRWIPREGPFVVATNHYYKPGYHAWWGIALITAALARSRPESSIVWLMANRWTYPQAWRSRFITPLTRVAFTRIAHVYGFVPTPPMPRQAQYTEEGADSVRQVLSLLDPRSAPTPIVGIAPEGRDSPDGTLIEPPPGTGRFLMHMSRLGLRMLPVGVVENAGVLTARFGAPFALGAWPKLSRAEQDREASAQVMAAIGALLPSELWGAFRTRIEQTKSGNGSAGVAASGRVTSPELHLHGRSVPQ